MYMGSCERINAIYHCGSPVLNTVSSLAFCNCIKMCFHGNAIGTITCCNLICLTSMREKCLILVLQL